jgi:hypothetical protein
MSYPAFENMPLWARVKALKDITEKNRTMKAGEIGTVIIRHAYIVGVRPDGKSLAINTGDQSALELAKEKTNE